MEQADDSPLPLSTLTNLRGLLTELRDVVPPEAISEFIASLVDRSSSSPSAHGATRAPNAATALSVRSLADEFRAREQELPPTRVPSLGVDEGDDELHHQDHDCAPWQEPERFGGGDGGGSADDWGVFSLKSPAASVFRDVAERYSLVGYGKLNRELAGRVADHYDDPLLTRANAAAAAPLLDPTGDALLRLHDKHAPPPPDSPQTPLPAESAASRQAPHAIVAAGRFSSNATVASLLNANALALRAQAASEWAGGAPPPEAPAPAAARGDDGAAARAQSRLPARSIGTSYAGLNLIKSVAYYTGRGGAAAAGFSERTAPIRHAWTCGITQSRQCYMVLELKPLAFGSASEVTLMVGLTPASTRGAPVLACVSTATTFDVAATPERWRLVEPRWRLQRPASTPATEQVCLVAGADMERFLCLSLAGTHDRCGMIAVARVTVVALR